ncbi:uncharacterized protein [Nicotiana tomentosiformis]|uniref:uncharacterized protein n=1 Tax=Nicotiana tomentosiformis TaxID=4098 RepID=UPI00051C459A|nr:uncharacterized protein LOC104108760 [Nicotiana tomentosiformis]
MATSLQFTSDHQYPINLSISQQDHHQTKPSAETMNQQTGRSRRSKGGANKSLTQKKKQSQRGMGVEKLERLRLQELISSKTNPLQFPKLYGGVNQVMAPDFLLHQRVANSGSSTYGPAHVTFGDQLISGHDQFQTQMGLNGFATSKPNQLFHAVSHTEKSKELSSLPNLMSIKSSCFSDRCSSCNKKKRIINGEDMGRSNTEAGIVHMENVLGENQYFGTKPLLHPFSIPSHLEKGVEIVAIHRRGNSSLSSEGGLVMEYEFFPTEKSGRSNTTSYVENDMMMKKMMTTSSESSSVAAAVGNGEASCVTTISWVDTTTTTTPTSSIDLSLKLSF